MRLAEVLDHEFVGTHPGSAINAALARGAAEAVRRIAPDVLGVPVDVLTPNGLPDKFRAAVLAEASPV